MGSVLPPTYTPGRAGVARDLPLLRTQGTARGRAPLCLMAPRTLRQASSSGATTPWSPHARSTVRTRAPLWRALASFTVIGLALLAALSLSPRLGFHVVRGPAQTEGAPAGTTAVRDEQGQRVPLGPQVLDGNGVRDASAELPQDGLGASVVSVAFDRAGAPQWRELVDRACTKATGGQRIAILLDGEATTPLGTYALIYYRHLVWLGATLTLPGLAGFGLAIGLAIDANALVFKRARRSTPPGGGGPGTGAGHGQPQGLVGQPGLQRDDPARGRTAVLLRDRTGEGLRRHAVHRRDGLDGLGPRGGPGADRLGGPPALRDRPIVRLGGAGRSRTWLSERGPFLMKRVGAWLA